MVLFASVKCNSAASTKSMRREKPGSVDIDDRGGSHIFYDNEGSSMDGSGLRAEEETNISCVSGPTCWDSLYADHFSHGQRCPNGFRCPNQTGQHCCETCTTAHSCYDSGHDLQHSRKCPNGFVCPRVEDEYCCSACSSGHSCYDAGYSFKHSRTCPEGFHCPSMQGEHCCEPTWCKDSSSALCKNATVCQTRLRNMCPKLCKAPKCRGPASPTAPPLPTWPAPAQKASMTATTTQSR